MELPGNDKLFTIIIGLLGIMGLVTILSINNVDSLPDDDDGDSDPRFQSDGIGWIASNVIVLGLIIVFALLVAMQVRNSSRFAVSSPPEPVNPEGYELVLIEDELRLEDDEAELFVPEYV